MAKQRPVAELRPSKRQLPNLVKLDCREEGEVVVVVVMIGGDGGGGGGGCGGVEVEGVNVCQEGERHATFFLRYAGALSDVPAHRNVHFPTPGETRSPRSRSPALPQARGRGGC